MGDVAAEEADDALVMHGRDDRDIGQMAAARQVWIVADEGIARLHVIKGVAREDRLDRTDHRTEMDGDVIGLGNEPAGRIEQGGRTVAALLDVGGEGGADQDRAHVLGNGQEAIAEHLHLDRVEEPVWRWSGRAYRSAHGRAHAATCRMMLPWGSTVALWPGRTIVVALISLMTHGPWTVAAAGSLVRS